MQNMPGHDELGWAAITATAIPPASTTPAMTHSQGLRSSPDDRGAAGGVLRRSITGGGGAEGSNVPEGYGPAAGPRSSRSEAGGGGTADGATLARGGAAAVSRGAVSICKTSSIDV